ncbi:dihydrofolate reductase family protein [soil metagenome]
MGRLIYAMNVSLDGYVETPDRSLDWTSVDDELHTWFNERAREIEASLYGRRMYELMAGYWPNAEADPAATGPEREFAAIWARTPRIVFSSSLASVEHNSRLVRGDIGEELASVRGEFAGDLDVSGATLAGSFIRRGLVDEYQLLVHPVVLGGGTPFFPAVETQLRLRLTETRSFASGVVYLGYRAL